MRNLLLLLLMTSSLFAVAQTRSTDSLRQKTLTLVRFLEQNHYQPIQWNDTTATRLYNRWIDILDDDKLLFSKKALAPLAGYSNKLDDELKGNGWQFFDQTINLYRAALQSADSSITLILAKPLDFTAQQELTWPLDAYPSTASDLYLEWHKYLKWKVLGTISDMISDTSKNETGPAKIPANFAALEIKARDKIKKQELLWVQNKLAQLQMPSTDMEDSYLSAICWCYDPHTEFMNAGAKSAFDTEMSGLEFSTGLEMDENEKGEWEITYLVPGGPAWRNGALHKGDIILTMQAGNKAELSMSDATIEQLNRIFESNSSEKISITVKTVGGAQKKVVLAKEKITNEEGVVKSYVLTGTKKIGYITLPGFYVKEGDETNGNGCSNDVAKEVVKLKKDSISGLILDLRYNGGGSLGEALELAGIFISEGSLTSTRDKDGKVHFLRDPNRGTIYDGPLLVMVNTMSASASELVTAALQDYHRALVVGSPTYGKGSAQVILPMDTTGKFSTSTSYDSYVKVTNSKFYRVDGSTNQWKGVLPDIELPDFYANDRFREKGIVSALQPDASKTAIYRPLPEIPFASLKANSQARISGKDNFKATLQFIDLYKSTNGHVQIPLQWSTYVPYSKKVAAMYELIGNNEEEKKAGLIKAVNNTLDQQRQQLITDQSRAINEINIKRIENDNYINESYQIMQDWLK